jgi:4-diphosphocytidyl-2-C-methyl-D-erythritol kinase
MLKNAISLSSMILFSPAKINIGLHITERRPDGFHNLQSVMYPVDLCDILEIRPSGAGNQALHFSRSGISSGEEPGDNLCEKAYKIMTREVRLPPVEIHLHKQIPVGAGLGGGSSNAAATLKGLNQLSDHPLSREKMHKLALSIGSDCPFFLHHEAMMMEGRGEILTPVSVKLDGLCLVLLFPELHISTAEAYAGVIPELPAVHLGQNISKPVDEWRGKVVNDFERGIFRRYPELEILKKELMKAGALYASLSGSGSSLFGIFTGSPGLPDNLSRYVVWRGEAGATGAVT